MVKQARPLKRRNSFQSNLSFAVAKTKISQHEKPETKGVLPVLF